MKSLHKHLPHFTGSSEQKKYHQGLRSTLSPDGSMMDNNTNMDTANMENKKQGPFWSMHKSGQQQAQQAQQTRKTSTGSLSDDELAAMPVEKQFDTDWDQTGHLVPDTEHFFMMSEQDMVGASNDEFHHPTM